MVQQLEKPVTVERREEATCRHHWIIEAPTSPVSNGLCLICDEVREFKNYIGPDPMLHTDPSLRSGRYPVVANHGSEEDGEEL